jgi:rare lipoprotein A
LNRLLHRRWHRAVALLPVLVLGVAGCHHKNPPVAYQPPPPIAPAWDTNDAGSVRPVRPSVATKGAASTSAGTAAGSISQPEPHGKPVSSEIGLASWYGPPYTNHKSADGSIYDQNAMTAAHRTLPMGSIVRVTNLTNNESVIVRITDRGPFIDGRIIDLSLAAAKIVDIYRPGTAKVRVEAYAPPERPGMDPAGKWCVQIGAFLDEADAVQLKNDLTRRYATAKVIEFAGPTGHWVRINPKNQDKTTANEIADSIHIPDPGAQPYLVRLD